MPFRLEVKYYNSFWLKQVSTNKITNNSVDTYHSVFPGLPFKTTRNKKNVNFPVWPKDNDDYDPTEYNPIKNFSNVNPDNFLSVSDKGSKWIIEESRIRGGFNNNQVDPGVRAYLKEDSNDVRYRASSLVYSGVYNNRTNINETNVFSIAEDITRTVDPHNGSIQFIHAMDNNLTIFQENKVSQALIDKDAIYSTEGNQTTAITSKVIGPVTPYVGDYGISRNPESFASYGFRRYFADKDRNSIMRLSRDGLTEISQYGMRDYFRDELSKIKDLKVAVSDTFNVKYDQETGVIPHGNVESLGFYIQLADGSDTSKIQIGSIAEFTIHVVNNAFVQKGKVTGIGTSNGNPIVFLSTSFTVTPSLNLRPALRFKYYKKEEIQGGYDYYKDNYILSMQKCSGSKTDDETSDYYSTLAFDESVKGWTTFYTYRPDSIFGLKNNTFTTKDGILYRHYDNNAEHNNFYGQSNSSNITFIFNANPGLSKNFKTIAYEGSDGWQVDSFVSDVTGDISSSYNTIQETRDTTNPVRSYGEGLYTENGIPYRIGFNRKDNKYVANLINNSSVSAGEVNFGNSITGIKGFFSIVTMSTDTTTNFGGAKELFAVSTEFVVSPR